jgi:polyhydroxybutyrate depolymerase
LSWFLAVACAGWLVTAPDAAAACGGPAEACTVALGAYHAAAPPWHESDEPRAAVIHFHGAGGSGTAVVGEPKLTGPIVARGYVLLAPTGLTRPGRTGGSWSFGVRPPLRDELAFVRQMLADAVPRFHLDRERVLVTGYSVGGSLAWYLACQAPGEFAAFAPVAGGFWRPHPTDCAGRVWLLHIHGWRDRTVPPEGRPLRPGLEQGDIFEGLQLWRRENGCTGLRTDVFATDAAFWRRAWTAWAPGSALELALHPGDHEVPNDWADMALEWFEAVVPASHYQGGGKAPPLAAAAVRAGVLG